MADVTIEKAKTFAEIIKEYGLNDEQVEFIQAYSKKRTTTRFEKEAAKLIGNPEMIKDWRYEGYYDTGYRGGDTCSLNHKLRYVHFARNIHTNESVKFGIKCVTDFFKLTPLALKLIRQGFNEANGEINECLAKFIKHGSFEKYVEKTDIVNRAEYVIENANNLLMRPYKDAFEESLLIGELMGFLTMKLPIPNWFEYRINSIYQREMTKLATPIDNDPLYKDSIAKAKKLITDSNFKANHADAYKTVNDMLAKLKQYSGLSPAAKVFFEKIVNVEWNVFDTILLDLKNKQRADFKDYTEFDFIQKILRDYDKYGMTEKQAAWVKKIHVRMTQPQLQTAL